VQQSAERFQQSLLRRAFLAIAGVYIGLLVITIVGQIQILPGDPQIAPVLALRILSLVVMSGALIWGLVDQRLPAWVPPATFALVTAFAIVAALGLRGQRLLSMAVFLFDSIQYLLVLGLFLRMQKFTVLSGLILLVTAVVIFRVLPAETFPQVLRPEELDAGFFSLLVLGLLVTTGIVAISNSVFLQVGRLVTESFHRLEAVAYGDAATGLPNGLQLEQDIAHWEQAGVGVDGKMVLLGFRLDGLEELNETQGVEGTNALVVEVVARYAEAVRDNANRYPLLGRPAPFRGLYRVESNLFLFFVTLPPGTSASFSSYRILDSVIRQALARRPPGLYLSFQGGYTVFPDDADSLAQLLRNLLNMLHSRRLDFEGQFVPFSREKYQEHIRRESLRLAIQHALAARDFRLVFQPKFAVATGQVTGFEALVRWATPLGVSIPPAEFIPLAEQTGQIVELTRQVFEQAFRFMQQESAVPAVVAINLSPGVLQPEFLDGLADQVSANGLGPWLQLEITEGSAMRLSEPLHQRLHRLRALGVTFAIDDFGTGYSNLGYLQDLDAEVLKIDKRFIDGIPGDSKNATLVTILIQMAHAFQMKVVAEGVEYQAQWDCLAELRCDEIQGFLASPPLAPEEALDLLRQP
jgi:EAL domain-containing protein (putative c-di-GMP-specific phosphodiesterase class I)/GGDEF domain-containing protein